MAGMFLSSFLFISTHISFDLLSLGSAETYIKWSKKTKQPFYNKLCQKYLYQKISKSDNQF